MRRVWLADGSASVGCTSAELYGKPFDENETGLGAIVRGPAAFPGLRNLKGPHSVPGGGGGVQDKTVEGTVRE